MVLPQNRPRRQVALPQNRPRRQNPTDDLLADLSFKAPKSHGIPMSASTKTMKANWMRSNPTRGEAAFGLLLAHLKISEEFAPQAQVAGYILDFYHCGLLKDGGRCKPFCVEIDGPSHLGTVARAKDAVRTRVLEQHAGLVVIRFTNNQVIKERQRVALVVMKMRATL